MLNFLGVGQNFSVLAETAWTSTFLFTDEVTGEAAELGEVTFEGWVTVQDEQRELTFSREAIGSLRHVLQVTMPELPEGRWEFEIYCAAETGEKSRMIYGYVSAVGGLDSEEGDTYANRTLEVRLPGDATRRIQLEWKASSMAQMAAQLAQGYAEKAEQAAKEIGDIAERAEAVMEKAEEAIEKLDGIQEIVDKAKDDIYGQITIDPVTRHWVIAGHDTGVRAVGEPGKSPRLTLLETWEVYDDVARLWVDTHIPARGQDGLDATAVRRILVDSYDDIPQSGELCSAGVMFYVRLDEDKYAVYAWLEDGTTSRWISVGESNDIASTRVYGFVKLGSDAIIESADDAEPVCRNSEGQMVTRAVPWATRDVGGKICLGSEVQTLNSQPYVQGIGATEDHKIANNLCNNGAIQHMTGADWKWRKSNGYGCEGMETEAMEEAEFYTGIQVSGQFTQERMNGLQLKPATTELLAGVHIATGIDDTREDAVLRPSEAKDAFPLKDDVLSPDDTYGRDELYTKDEVDKAIADAVKEVKSWIENAEQLDYLIPPGVIVYSGLPSMSGWLLCNGKEVSRTEYSKLYSAIGIMFGAGDGKTTFNLPDLRARVAWGAWSTNLGKQISAGLPNIKGKLSPINNGGVTKLNKLSDALDKSKVITSSTLYYGGGGNKPRGLTLEFDASRSNKIYGNSSTVQPPALALNAFIKI